jgi:hypothetical protein
MLASRLLLFGLGRISTLSQATVLVLHTLEMHVDLSFSYLRLAEAASFDKKELRRSCTGSLTRDFRLQVFFMNQCPPGPQVFHWGCFEIFRKFAEIFTKEYLTPVSTTPAKNLLPVSQGNNQKT